MLQYDFGSRMYDASVGRWHTLDPQAESFYGYSPYMAMGNNPVMLVDPDGELPLLAIALIGGAINAGVTALNGGGTSAIVESFLKGAIAGAVGGAAGQVASPGLGALGGAKAGAINGASAGFASSFTSSLLNGEHIGDSFENGLKSAAIGGGIGGIVGGARGGISASKHGGNFWSGDGATFDLVATTGNGIKVGDGLEYSNKYANDFSDEYFGEVKGLNKLYADNTLPSKKYSRIGDDVFNSKNKRVIASTKYLGGKKSNVYLYRGAFASKTQLYLTMQHEYLHVVYNNVGYFSAKYHNNQHSSIYKWQSQQAKEWNFYKTKFYSKQADKYLKYHNNIFDKYLPKIQKTRPF